MFQRLDLCADVVDPFLEAHWNYSLAKLTSKIIWDLAFIMVLLLLVTNFVEAGQFLRLNYTAAGDVDDYHVAGYIYEVDAVTGNPILDARMLKSRWL